MSVVAELRSTIEQRFRDIKDIVFEMNAEILAKMERYINLHEGNSGPQCKEVSEMSRNYLALFEVAAQDYREKFGTKYQAETILFIERCLKNQKTYFDDNGILKVYPTDTVVCIRLQSGTTIDFCFGSFEKLRLQITSKYYICFGRDDVSDLQLLNKITSLMNELGAGQFTNRVAKKLMDEGIMYAAS